MWASLATPVDGLFQADPCQAVPLAVLSEAEGAHLPPEFPAVYTNAEQVTLRRRAVLVPVL